MSDSKEFPVQIAILAGGQGARFWPLSRMARPKQFLSISKSGESLIQATARRVEELAGPDSVHVVTNIQHVPLLKDHLPEANVIVEPVGRNTAAAIGLAAVAIRKHSGGDPVLICLPADHAVSSEQTLRGTLQHAIDQAIKTDSLVTIGVTPTFANTAYGYIQRGEEIGDDCFKVHRFYEKPNTIRRTWATIYKVAKGKQHILRLVERHRPKFTH
jgi:mannose-1-phosphate guanylyltransferase